jgi:hypothetical protein
MMWSLFFWCSRPALNSHLAGRESTHSLHFLFLSMVLVSELHFRFPTSYVSFSTRHALYPTLHTIGHTPYPTLLISDALSTLLSLPSDTLPTLLSLSSDNEHCQPSLLCFSLSRSLPAILRIPPSEDTNILYLTLFLTRLSFIAPYVTLFFLATQPFYDPTTITSLNRRSLGAHA